CTTGSATTSTARARCCVDWCTRGTWVARLARASTTIRRAGETMTTSARTETAPQVTDFELSPELRAFRDTVRDYARTWLGKAAEWDAEMLFPREAVAAAARLGLLCTTVAREHGGSQMGNLASCVMLEEVNA